MPSLIRKFSEAVKNSTSNVTCWGTGKPLREFMYVEDLAEAIIFSLEHWDPEGLRKPPKDTNGSPLFFLNVGTGETYFYKKIS